MLEWIAAFVIVGGYTALIYALGRIDFLDGVRDQIDDSKRQS